jgi:hypothetical protein
MLFIDPSSSVIYRELKSPKLEIPSGHLQGNCVHFEYLDIEKLCKSTKNHRKSQGHKANK